MNTVILSGGTGNHALVNGLKDIYPDMKIDIILNAYDDGKSTGVCRKVMNVLGPSDIRKNHVRLYQSSTENPDKRIIEFYENRYNFNKGFEAIEMKALLDKWGLKQFNKYVDIFFADVKAKDYTYNDFNVSNIVYAAMFNQDGYENTIQCFEDLLDIKDHITLNSFDNLILKAHTENGKVLEDEASIVDFCSKDDYIMNIFFEHKSASSTINPKAIQLIENADFIIISAGTFWSSIYPTLIYNKFADHINKSKAKKLWIMNTEEDGDSYNVSSLSFALFMEDVLNMNDFTILLNGNAIPSLKETKPRYNAITRNMGNVNGKHNAHLLAKECFKCYFNLQNNIDKYILDFDDTIWSRRYLEDSYLDAISRDNLRVLNKLSDVKDITIISGNSYKSIKDKIYSEFGTSMDDFGIHIWADANAICYYYDGIVHKFLAVDQIDKVKQFVSNLVGDNLLEERGSNGHISSLSIKPVTNEYRRVLAEYINYWLKAEKISNKALVTGFATIDIVHIDNDKSKVIEYMNGEWEGKKTYYIGDEVDGGNDKSIADACDYKYHVSSVKETNIILGLIADDLQVSSK